MDPCLCAKLPCWPQGVGDSPDKRPTDTVRGLRLRRTPFEMCAPIAVLVPLADLVFVGSDVKRVVVQEGLPSRRSSRSHVPRTLPALSARAISARTMLTRVLRLDARRSDRFSHRKKQFRSYNSTGHSIKQGNSTHACASDVRSVLRCPHRGRLRQLTQSRIGSRQ